MNRFDLNPAFHTGFLLKLVLGHVWFQASKLG
jgi:hypothetical protein